MTTHSEPTDPAPTEPPYAAGPEPTAAPAIEPESVEHRDPEPSDLPTQRLATTAAEPTAEPIAVRKSRPPLRRRLLFWTAIAAALAMIGAGGYQAVTSYQAQTTPEHVVLDYFAALRQGDAATALAYGDVPAGDHELLTDEVLAAQNAIAPMGAATPKVTAETATSATASVHYRLAFDDGEVTVADTVDLVRDGRTWRLASVAVPASILVVNGGSRVTFAGAAVPSGEHLLFPGALPVEFDTPYMALDARSRVVRLTQPRDIPETAGLSDEGKEAVDAALDAALGACLDGSAADLTLCPLPTEARAVPGSLRGTPVAAVSSVADYVFTYEEGLIRISADVTVKGEYEQLDFNNQRLTKTGDLKISILASCDATSPDVITWRTV